MKMRMHLPTHPVKVLSLFAFFLPPLLSGIGQEELERESLRLRNEGGTVRLYGSPAEESRDPVPAARAGAAAKKPRSGTSDRTLRSGTREHLLDIVDKGWSRPDYSPVEPGQSDRLQQDAIRGHLEEVFIPKVEFRQLPLSEALEALAEIARNHSPNGTGLNMVLIDPEGRDPLVSILLRRLSLKRILDFVVESVAYEYDLQSDAVVIRPSQGPGFGLETAFYPVSRSTLIRLTGIHEGDTPQDPTGLADPFGESPDRLRDERSQTEQALKGFLQRAGIPFERIEGANLALADGQLIVTQTPRNHGKLERLLRRYREVKQVEIEARFLEVEERNLEELGVEWTLIGEDGDRMGNAPARYLAGAFSVGEEESRLVIDRPGIELPSISHGPPILPISVDLAEDGEDFLSLGTPLGELDLQLLIRALERQSGNDLLSAPKLTVLSGKTARITVAEEFRYPESYGDTDAEVGMGDSSSGSAGVAITAGTPRSFTTRNVGVEMEVTPTVEEDNSISLLLQPTVTEFEGFVEYGGSSIAIASDTTVTVPSGFYQPVFSVREVQTEVTIWDGATLVMGGLVREHAVRVLDKVPLLGDLPLLGNLFRTEGESTQKRNLLIFVTARLVSPGGSAARQQGEGSEFGGGTAWE